MFSSLSPIEVVLGEGEYELSVERDPNYDDDVITVDQDMRTITARGLGRTTLSVTHPSVLPPWDHLT